jgi:hypothetical protein
VPKWLTKCCFRPPERRHLNGLQRPYSAFLQSGDREQARSDHIGEQLGSLRDDGVSRPATDLHRGLRRARPSSLLITACQVCWPSPRAAARLHISGALGADLYVARRPPHQSPATAAGSSRQPSQANLVGQVRDPLARAIMKHATLMNCGHCAFNARGLAVIEVGRGLELPLHVLDTLLPFFLDTSC